MVVAEDAVGALLSCEADAAGVAATAMHAKLALLYGGGWTKPDDDPA